MQAPPSYAQTPHANGNPSANAHDPTSLDSLRSIIRMTFSARNLPSMDLLSPSDPMVVVSCRENNTWKRVGRTEAIIDNNNPDFQTQIKVDYYFEKEQRYRIEIYDVDTKNYDKLDDHDYIGSAEFILGKLMSTPHCVLKLPLRDKNNVEYPKAFCNVRADEVQESQEVAMISINAIKLHKQSFFGKDTTVLQLFRVRKDNTLFQVYQTAPVAKTQDPNYMQFTIPVGLITGMELDAEVVLRVCRLKGTKLTPTGQVCVRFVDLVKQDVGSELPKSLQQVHSILQSGGQAESPSPEANGNANIGLGQKSGNAIVSNYKDLYETKTFTLQKVQEKKMTTVQCTVPNTNQGSLVIQRFHIYRPYSILDFLKGGLDLRLMIAIDFTASNQNPRSPSSLHYINTYQANSLNAYERAIISVGSVLTSYTNKQHFPIFGFGGIPQNESHTSHCFPLTPSTSNMNQIPGIDGVLAQYRHAIQTTSLSGPTYFAEIIDTVHSMVLEPYRLDSQHYTVLLIITDGIINDMMKTIDSIVKVSDKPLSIIIVGVGAADFENMDILDGDEQRLQSNTGIAVRDIVQFVPMREVENQGANAIATHTLAEVPAQVVSFMNLHSIQPMVRE